LRLYVGITDRAWFDHLAGLVPEEVNYWRPRAQGTFRALSPGELFLFKLHSPLNYIVGGGIFAHYTRVPLSLAWELFGPANGAPDLGTLRRRIGALGASRELDPPIGCIILSSPFILSQAEWIPAPASWHASIQQGKTYSTEDGEGRLLWVQLQDRLQRLHMAEEQVSIHQLADPGVRYGALLIHEPRLGQGGFRARVTDAYDRRCALTGERVLPVLEAAHIRDHAESGPNSVSNGLLLRADLHNLFDRGYLTVTTDLRIEVSQGIHEEFNNGREYLRLHGQPLVQVPRAAVERPSPEFLRWHNENRYRG